MLMAFEYIVLYWISQGYLSPTKKNNIKQYTQMPLTSKQMTFIKFWTKQIFIITRCCYGVNTVELNANALSIRFDKVCMTAVIL